MLDASALATPTAQRPPRALSPEERKQLRSDREVARRRAKNARDEAHLAALEFAQKIYRLADEAPDVEAASDLYKVVNSIRVRYAQDENIQRRAVLRALEACTLTTARDIAKETRLPLATVEAILEDFASPDKGLAFSTTMGGHQNSGRNGTVQYWGLRH